MNRTCTVAALALLTSIACGAPALAGNLEEGIVQYRVENFEEALSLLEKARAEQPGSSVAAFYLGMARKQTGDITGAIRDLSAAVRLLPPVLDAYLELADAYHVSGDEKKALEWAIRSEKEGVKPGQSAFMRGLALAGLSKGDEAISAFEQAKKLDPTLTQAADLQIAMALAGSRKITRARDALRAVVAADPNSEIASYAKEYEQSFTRVIEDYRPLRLTVGLNYLYDDNAISNPSNPAARAVIGNPTGERDHAFLGNFRMDYTPLPVNDLVFSAQYLLQTTEYTESNTDEENPSTVISALTVNPGYSVGSSILSLPIGFTHVLLKDHKYQSSVSVRPTWSWQAAPQHIVQLGTSFTRRDMLQDALAVEEDRDAHVGGANAGYIYSYGTQGGMAAARYDFSYDSAKGDNWKNRTHRWSLNGIVPLTDAVKLNLGGEVSWQDYLKTHTVFNTRRDDTTWYGTAGLSWSVTENITLSAQYAHTRADSNIAVYDYDRNTFSAGIEFGF